MTWPQIHLQPERELDPDRWINHWHTACGAKNIHTDYISPDLDAVTCFRCMRTKRFQALKDN